MVCLSLFSFVQAQEIEAERGVLTFGNPSNKLLNSLCATDGKILQRNSGIWVCADYPTGGNGSIVETDPIWTSEKSSYWKSD
jgi:hypothetical protein